MAIILATAIAIAVVVLTLASGWSIASVHESPLDTEAATLLSTAFGAVIGAIATYLGGRNNLASKSPPENTEDTDDGISTE